MDRLLDQGHQSHLDEPVFLLERCRWASVDAPTLLAVMHQQQDECAYRRRDI